MKSKLFLVAIAALIMGAFAIVGCEPAATPAEEGTTTGSTESAKDGAAVEGQTATEGGEVKSDEGAKTEGDMTGEKEGSAEGVKAEGASTEPAPEGDTHTEGEGH